MNQIDLISVVSNWCGDNGSNFTTAENIENLHRASKGEEHWRIVVRADQDAPDDCLHQFESGMDELIAGQSESYPDTNFGYAISFTSTENGDTTSYRRPLKKYSKSIVFDDLNIHLFLARDNGTVEVIALEQANTFLGDLNQYIARKQAGKREEG